MTPATKKTNGQGFSRHERTVLVHGATWFFLILFGYFILRPIRGQISASYGIENLSWLFLATFGTMLVAIPLYSILVARFHRTWLVPLVYVVFISNLFAFWTAMQFGSPNLEIWVARALFVWISVYGLFIVSFFWSVIGDMLSTPQGKRLYGYMAGGGTMGALVGSQTASQLVDHVGIANLLWIPMGLLVMAMLVYGSLEFRFAKLPLEPRRLQSGQATGGNPFAGFSAVVKSKYLLAICLYGFILATCGTNIYFQQSEIINQAYETKEARTKYFANLNFCVQALTLVFQLGVVNRLMRSAGLAWTLAVLPMVYIGGISSLAISPTVTVLAVISVVGLAAEYGVTNPAREVLFTAVKREDRYKAKSFIDTIVRRGGDTLIGAVYRGLRESAGFAMTTLSWLVVPIAVAWVFLGLFIGRENLRQASIVQPFPADSGGDSG